MAGSTKAEFKAVPFRAVDHASIDETRTKLSFYRGKQMSLAETLMEAKELLDKKIKREYEANK